MRRLAVVFSLLLALLAATGAAAAKPAPNLVVTKGSADARGGRLRGSFIVINRGRARSPRSKATVRLTPRRDSKAPLLTLQRTTVPPLAVGAGTRIAVSAQVPLEVAGSWRVLACATRCLRIGHLTSSGETEGAASAGGRSSSPKSGSGSGAPGGSGGTSSGASGSGSTPGGGSTGPPAPPISTVPTDPLHPEAERPFRHVGGGVEYWGYVPSSYDTTNLTPTPLLIWLHGCYGEAEGEAWVVDPGEEMQPPQDWLTLTLAGREGGAEGVCWVPSVDEAKVMAALADFETHFNVDPRRVILGGYSSGGDLAYRTGFRHSATFAGLLIENSSPFRDTESTEAESLAAATTKLHIVHLAHLQDDTYPIAGVRTETEAVKAAGFPIERIEVPGEHWNEEGEVVAGHVVAGTDADLRTYLLPHIDDGWLAPAP